MAEKFFFQNNSLSRTTHYNLERNYNESKKVQEDIDILKQTIFKLNIFKDEPMLQLHSRQMSEYNFRLNTEEDFNFKSKFFKNDYKQVTEIKLNLPSEKRKAISESDIEIDGIVDRILEYNKLTLTADNSKELSEEKISTVQTNDDSCKKHEDEEVNFSISDFSLADRTVHEDRAEVEPNELLRYIEVADHLYKEPIDYVDTNELNLSPYTTKMDNEVSLILNSKKCFKESFADSYKFNDSTTGQESIDNANLTNSSIKKRVSFTEGNMIKCYNNKSRVGNYIIRSKKIPKKVCTKVIKPIIKSASNEVINEADKNLRLAKLNELITECSELTPHKVVSKENISQKIGKVPNHLHPYICKRFEKNPSKFYTDALNMPSLARKK
jgi:hypothetical protein